MKRLLAFALLAACTKAPSAPPADVPGLLRNPTAPLASQADATADRLVGKWYLRQTVAFAEQAGREIEITKTPDGNLLMSSQTVDCSDVTNLCEGYRQEITLAPDGPGRWAVVASNDGFPNDPLWVLWLDFDDRTAAIGGPTGRFVWIMDRAETGGGDRLVAAREILTWYGYDVSKFVKVGP